MRSHPQIFIFAYVQYQYAQAAETKTHSSFQQQSLERITLAQVTKQTKTITKNYRQCFSSFATTIKVQIFKIPIFPLIYYVLLLQISTFLCPPAAAVAVWCSSAPG